MIVELWGKLRVMILSSAITEKLLSVIQYRLLNNMEKFIMRNTAAIMRDGIQCLLEKLGALETEVFVWNLLKEQFDYTEWKKDFFRDGNLEDFNRDAAEFDKQNPFVKTGE